MAPPATSTIGLFVSGMFVVVGLGMVGLGIGLIYYGRKGQAFTSEVSETETSEIRSLSPGTVEIKGTAHPTDEQSTLTAPVTGTDALVYTVAIEKWTGGDVSNWSTLYEDEVIRPFVVDDDTGRARVDPTEAATFTLDSTRVDVAGDEEPPAQIRRFVERTADVDSAPKGEGGLLGSGERRRYSEEKIEPGEEVYVLGEAVDSTGEWDGYEITGGDGAGDFVISDYSEAELVEKGSMWTTILYGVGGVVAVFGFAIAAAGLAFLVILALG